MSSNQIELKDFRDDMVDNEIVLHFLMIFSSTINVLGVMIDKSSEVGLVVKQLIIIVIEGWLGKNPIEEIGSAVFNRIK